MDRKEDRLKKSLRVVLKDGDQTYPAIITSISKTGMSVKVNIVFPTFKEIDVVVKAEQKMLELKGSVRWVNAAPKDSEEQLHETGIGLHTPPEEYTRNFD